MSNKILVHRARLDDNFIDNTLYGINTCLDLGYSVEVDVHFIMGKYYLGHDPNNLTEISINFLDRENIFIHLKTPCEPHLLYADSFYITNDPIVYTRLGRQWVNVGTNLCNTNTIICSNELVGLPFNIDMLKNALACGAWICTKYPRKIKE